MPLFMSHQKVRLSISWGNALESPISYHLYSFINVFLFGLLNPKL
jgi:hypothetical protein